MPTSAIQVSLSQEDLAFLRGKVASGEYESEDAAIRACIEQARLDEAEQLRFEQEEAGWSAERASATALSSAMLSRFEMEEVIPAYEESLADPGGVLSIDQVCENLEASRKKRAKVH